MKKARIIYFNEMTGNGRLKVMAKRPKFLNYLELHFDWHALGGKFDIKEGQDVEVLVRNFNGIPYVEKVVK